MNVLLPIRCSKCNRFLCEGPAGSDTYCPFCKTWTKAVNDKKKKEQLATVATDTRTKKYSTTGTRPRVQGSGITFEQEQLFN